MKMLLILNDPPYGSERSYNALRLASSVAKADPSAELVVFLMADAASAAKSGQQPPNGYYNLERMLKGLTVKGARVLLCGTCMDARGLQDDDLLEGCKRSSMDELTQITLAADKVLVF